MTTLFFIKPADVYIDLSHSALKAVQGDRGLEIALDRLPNGRLSDSCRDHVVVGLRQFLRKKSRLGRPRAYCAIGARGVTLRRVTLPPSSRDNTRQLLELQIEKDFPLSPRELAWGFYPVVPEEASQSDAPREVILVAVKKELLEDYTRLLSEANLNPVFTLNALAISSLCAETDGNHAVLNVGQAQSEFIVFDRGVPVSVRCLAFGKDQISRDQGAVQALAAAVQQSWSGRKLYLAGDEEEVGKMASHFQLPEGGGRDCQALEFPPGEGRSAANFGMRHGAENNHRCPSLVLQVPISENNFNRRPVSALQKWAVLAGLLALASFAMRYAEAVFRKPALAQRLDQLKSNQQDRPEVGRELSFYQYLETNRPPYLEALAHLADSASRGTQLSSVSMNRQGELSLRGTMSNSKQATDFRSKLIDSGWFTTVVLEDQTPVGNDPKVNVRISAHWRPPALTGPVHSSDTNGPTAALSAVPAGNPAPVPAK